jgi:thymidine kinase
MGAKLYYTYGTMSSAKTLELLSLAYTLEKNGDAVLSLKSSIDTREGDNAIIKSRAGLQRDCIIINDDQDIYEPIKQYVEEIRKQTNKRVWVFVDECQFLTPRQVDELAAIVDDFDVNVFCFGLRTDFQSHLFPGAARLFELADTITEKKTYCKCGGKAIINARVDGDGNVLNDGEQVLIGGDECYVPMCRKCWKERSH